MNELLTIKIRELTKRAPKGWVITLSTKMGKQPSTIYAYANGTRPKLTSERLQLKKLLTEIVDNHEKSILNDLID